MLLLRLGDPGATGHIAQSAVKRLLWGCIGGGARTMGNVCYEFRVCRVCRTHVFTCIYCGLFVVSS